MNFIGAIFGAWWWCIATFRRNHRIYSHSKLIRLKTHPILPSNLFASWCFRTRRRKVRGRDVSGQFFTSWVGFRVFQFCSGRVFVFFLGLRNIGFESKLFLKIIYIVGPPIGRMCIQKKFRPIWNRTIWIYTITYAKSRTISRNRTNL